MSELIRTYNEETGKEYKRRPSVAAPLPRVVAKGRTPASAMFAGFRAYGREMNRRQNIVRWSYTAIGLNGVWNPGAFYGIVFDSEHLTNPRYKGRTVLHTVNSLWKFECDEPGLYNVKGFHSGLISVPAAPVTRITKAELWLKRKRFSNGLTDAFLQGVAYAPVRVLPPNGTEQLYLLGWNIGMRDKLDLEPGDQVWPEWRFIGMGQIGYFEEMNASIALQKTGVAYIDGDCLCE